MEAQFTASGGGMTQGSPKLENARGRDRPI